MNGREIELIADCRLQVIFATGFAVAFSIVVYTINSMKKKRQQDPAEYVARNCIAFRLRLVNRAVTRLYNEEYRKFGVTVSQMNILVAICRMGQVKQQAICKALHLDKSTLSRDVVRMLEKGWLRSLPGEDGRTNYLIATAEGEKLLAKTFPAWSQAQRRAKTLLQKEGLLGLEHAITTIRSVKSP